MTFKIGDRVKYTGDLTPLAFGKTGSVRDVSGQDSIFVAWDDGSNSPISVYSHNLTLIDPKAGKFKVGDRVRCIADTDGRGKGCVGSVTCADNFWPSITVKFDAPFDGHGEDLREWNCDSSTLVAATAGRPCIVAQNQGHGPRPSSVPFVHASAEDAATEARRLAAANPGVTFEVYELVSRSVAPAPVAVTEAM